MTEEIRSIPLSGPVDARATVPGSKSLTNRSLLIAALAEGTSVLTGALDSEDTQIMFAALKQLGLTVQHDQATCTMTIEGQGGIFPVKKAEIYVGNSGTTARFLTAALARSDGYYRIYGKPRMHERPIGDLVRALLELGADVVSEAGNEAPPLRIRGRRDLKGMANVSAGISSQYLSGLLMMSVGSPEAIVLNVDGELVSRPYIEMTLANMKAFGAEVQTDAAFRRFSGFEKTRYLPGTYAIEPDASAASYFFAIPAVVGGRVTIPGLSRKSLQGDVGFVECLAAMGCNVVWGENEITVERPVLSSGQLAPLIGIDVDMNEISDTVQTLSVVAMFAESPTRIRNVAHIRHKETDRIAAVVSQLRKFGTAVDEFDDGLLIRAHAGQKLTGATVETFDDHRMAMSFSLAGLVLPGTKIENPRCTEKTYPAFFDDLAKVVVPIGE
ncbi:MAG: 3-phosphoshikimate 1-carboxyvinyltransferase [Planctomycetia bacterium]|nr:3-phosphoshikimate 1-carboxyvinyltransferase [Planctomycetia bacterium]